MCQTCFSRRTFLRGGAALSTMAVAGCDRVSLVSDEEVAAMGQEAWQQMVQTTDVSQNRAYRDLLERVTLRLLDVTGEDPSEWQVAVFAKPDINAFALPGKRIGVFEGMFEVTETEDQLAAIVGHEIGHLDAEHGKERIEAQVATNAGIRLLAWLLNAGDVQYADEIAAALGLGVQYGVLLPYNRDQELEADRLGLETMAAAAFDPREAVTLWERMEAATGRRGPEFLATHPAPQSRIQAIKAQLPALTDA